MACSSYEIVQGDESPHDHVRHDASWQDTPQPVAHTGQSQLSATQSIARKPLPPTLHSTQSFSVQSSSTQNPSIQNPSAPQGPSAQSLLVPGPSVQQPSANHPSDDGRPCSSLLLLSKARRTQRRTVWQWKWELLWALLSLLSLAASCVLLAWQNNRRIDSWTAFFSLNTFISVLAQVSRTSLAFGVSSSLGQAKWNFFRGRPGSLSLWDSFDQASRGPWGSVNMVYRLRLRHLVTIGAVVTILLLGFEPFLQAVITQYGQLDVDALGRGPQATIAQAQRVDLGVLTEISSAHNPVFGGGWTGTDWGMQADYGLTTAVYNGFYTSVSQRALPPFACPTGNCTFGTYSSLGVYSACVDVSSHIRMLNGTGPLQGKFPPPDHSLQHMTYSLPGSGLNISNFNGLRDETDGIASYAGSGIQVRTSSTLATAVLMTGLSDTLSFRPTSDSTAFAVFQVLQATQAYINNETDWKASPPKAMECSLHFCANIYSASVNQGILNETLEQTLSIRDAKSYQPIGSDITPEYVLEGWDESHSYALYLGENDFKRTDLQITIPAEEASRLRLPDSQPRRFNITQSTIYTTADWLSTKFAPSQLYYPASGVAIDALLNGAANDGAGQIIGNSSNLEATFRAVAESMTMHIREKGLESGFVQPGSSLSWVFYYRIRWPFLAPPVALTLVGCLFLLYVIWETRVLELDPWRDSAVAALAHGVDAEMRADLRIAYQKGIEEKTAKETVVMLGEADGGLELCRVVNDARADISI